ncbi:MAG: hypothetical protein AB1657_01690 [Candidatus Micrarchaeota archaeon]
MRGWVFALVLLAISFAAEECAVAPCVFTPNLNPAANPGLIGSLVLLSVAFVALSYMVSTALQNPSAVAWSKEQLRELIAGVVVVVVVYGAVITANSLISGVTGEPDAVSLGSAALDPIIRNLEGIYGKVGEAYFAVAVQQGASLGYVVGNLGYVTYSESRMPLFGVNPLYLALSNAASQLTMQILSFQLVKVLLGYISSAVPGFFLPLGMVFRIFPFTKKLGNTLIALSLGALFMLPASLFLVKEMYGLAEMPHAERAMGIDFDERLSPWMTSGSISGVRAFCENTALRLPTELGEIFWGAVYATIMAPTCNVGYFACWLAFFETFVFAIWPFAMFIIQNTASILVSTAASDTSGIADEAYSATVEPIAAILLPAVSEVNTFSIIAVVVIAVFTFSGTKAISAALGGEYVLYGISRLV